MLEIVYELQSILSTYLKAGHVLQQKLANARLRLSRAAFLSPAPLTLARIFSTILKGITGP